MMTPSVGTRVYRAAARLSARVIARSPVVESVVLRRSAATGEVSFGRSDIDLLVVMNPEQADTGRSVASLYRLVRRARVLNPRMRHVELGAPADLASRARIDTCWASLERRSQIVLRGKPFPVPDGPVDPDHALNRFLLWAETFFASAVQQRNRRNLRKTALEAWDAFTVAAGLEEQPCLLRAEIEQRLRRADAGVAAAELEDVSTAVRFVFGLADRLHRLRLPALGALPGPLVFDATCSPIGLRRRFVVVPAAGAPLPAQAFAPGTFPCTPELLHLFVHAKNPLFSWIIPAELVEIGFRPPAAAAFLDACRYYGHHRFLLTAGFLDHRAPPQGGRLSTIRHVLGFAARGEVPPAIAQAELEASMGTTGTPIEYYLNDFERLCRESRQLQAHVDSIRGRAPAAEV